jgi:uncharacterized protein with GYD domain
MAVYLVLMTVPDTGKKGADEYSDKLQEVNKVVDYLGAKILSQYALLGPYDFVNIIEAPSDEAVAKLSIYLRSLVGIQTTTYAAIPIENLLSILQKKKLPF